MHTFGAYFFRDPVTNLVKTCCKADAIPFWIIRDDALLHLIGELSSYRPWPDDW